MKQQESKKKKRKTKTTRKGKKTNQIKHWNAASTLPGLLVIFTFKFRDLAFLGLNTIGRLLEMSLTPSHGKKITASWRGTKGTLFLERVARRGVERKERKVFNGLTK